MIWALGAVAFLVALFALDKAQSANSPPSSLGQGVYWSTVYNGHYLTIQNFSGTYQLAIYASSSPQSAVIGQGGFPSIAAAWAQAQSQINQPPPSVAPPAPPPPPPAPVQASAPAHTGQLPGTIPQTMPTPKWLVAYGWDDSVAPARWAPLGGNYWVVDSTSPSFTTGYPCPCNDYKMSVSMLATGYQYYVVYLWDPTTGQWSIYNSW